MRNSFINKRFANDGVYNVTFYIIAANIIVYLLFVFNVSIKGVPIVNYLALTPIYVIKRLYLWQFITYMFVCPYPSVFTFCIVMLVMFSFGYALERQIGSLEFLTYYLSIGIFSAICSFITYIIAGYIRTPIVSPWSVMLAVEFLFAMCNPYARVMFFFFIPMRAPIAVLVIFAMELIFGIAPIFGGRALNAVWLYAILGAWIYTSVRLRMRPLNFWKSLFTPPSR